MYYQGNNRKCFITAIIIMSMYLFFPWASHQIFEGAGVTLVLMLSYGNFGIGFRS